LLVAFFSDIHSNLPALEAAVADAIKRGVSQMFCAGDITGYGPFPNEACEFLQTCHIEAIAGNYDAKVLRVVKEGPAAIDDLPQKKQKIVLWTAKHISKLTREYLAGLPAHLDLGFPGGDKVLVVHGTPLNNDDDIYPSITERGLKAKMGDVQSDVLICGHTHIPFAKKVGHMLVVNCGSVGQPVDGDPRLAYAIVNFNDDKAARGHIFRVEYDLDRIIFAMKETSLPKGLRKDLALGTKRMFLQ
jgi:predicted phosphodiesterase